MWAAIDDTDSTEGGCTTFTASKCIHALERRGIDLIGRPRLVRLNPNIPWKTRGNGALAFRIGKGRGDSFVAGEMAGMAIRAFSDFEELNAEEMDRAFRILEEMINRMKKTGNDTNPGLVLMESAPPKGTYYEAVRSVVKLGAAEENIKLRKMAGRLKYRAWGNGRGLTGAMAALAWPEEKKTYELIAYRAPGEERKITADEAKRIDSELTTTFNNIDEVNRDVAIVPNTPCPVLYGVRGTDPDELLGARDIIAQKGIGWMLFESNQASGDHMVHRKISCVKEHESAIVEANVSKEPHDMKGGHVFFSASDDSGEIECAAFEPTKEFRDIVRQLGLGDKVKLFGAFRKDTLNLEAIEILEMAEKLKKVSNPRCPECGKAMKSIGTGQGYRCIECKQKLPEEAAAFEVVERTLELKKYIVPVCARRHLTDIGLFDYLSS